MTTSTKANMVIYQDGFQTGMLEALEQEVSVLNATSSIVVVTENTRGEFLESAFFTQVDNLVTDRDPTSLASVTPSGLDQAQIKDILCNYKIGPNANTMDSFRKINEDPQLMSFLLGEMAGAQLAEKYLNDGLGALVAAISTEAGMVFDTRGTFDSFNASADISSISFQNLNKVMGLMGDKRSRLRMWVMPSSPHTSLIGHQISEKLGEVSGATIYGGSPGTFGLPVYVTDSPALSFVQDVRADGGGTAVNVDRHYVLGLTEQALVIQQNNYFDMAEERKTGGENLVIQWQAEGTYLVRLKGFSWTGSNAPTGGQLATDTNWSYAFASVKAGPGVMLVVDDVNAIV